MVDVCVCMFVAAQCQQQTGVNIAGSAQSTEAGQVSQKPQHTILITCCVIVRSALVMVRVYQHLHCTSGCNASVASLHMFSQHEVIK